MKLHLVPARTGFQWVKTGVRTFFRQPLALSGLFLLFMALMSLIGIIPVVGNMLALMLLPGATLGLMAAAQEAANGKFPNPTIMLNAFRVERKQYKSMLLLGALYAAGFMLVMAISASIDGGQFARIYLFGGDLSPEILARSDFETAVLVAAVLYMPLSLLFWHAPALVHWHGVPPIKALFFSLVACLRNFAAFAVYNIAWVGLFLLMGLAVTILSAVLGNPEFIGNIIIPLGLLMATMYFTSIYATFADSFVDEHEGQPPGTTVTSPTNGS